MLFNGHHQFDDIETHLASKSLALLPNAQVELRAIHKQSGSERSEPPRSDRSLVSSSVGLGRVRGAVASLLEPAQAELVGNAVTIGWSPERDRAATKAHDRERLN